jgi:type II secretory pathway component GspD/PulD (secretin)
VSHSVATRRPSLLRPAARASFAALLLTAAALPGHAQEQAHVAGVSVRVFHLANVARVEEASHISIALRNMLNANDRVYFIEETNDIAVAAPPEELALAERLIAEMDRPKRTYRLTYTIAESDAGKRVGVRHFSMVVVTGQRVVLKQGDKIPVATGSFSTEQKATQTQFTYLDIGINLDATIDQFGNGLRLRSKVEQSSGSESVTIENVQEPVIRQSVLEGTSVIVPGKPLVLGGIDVAGSTRHMDVEVVAEPLS